MSDSPVVVVREGWDRREEVGDAKALLTYPAGVVSFEHVCDRGGRGVIVCAPRLQFEGGHTLTRSDADSPATVQPSILCDDCGTHGFVTDGVWRSC
ncbi:hypothetical protein [Aeromicrobium fastidiosum]|uniref:Uncharacterized protein n=1 Tax=Aeromicrobium fastidiosum TaxID=52699 RepID=A0A641ANJ2_9ACTN|nr:hypothetical protein [Aeromicrobium fastidiosum]KAA1376372.1 hypothetical protein ESP62_013135 [Aeromicrobium fastidiosum]MBP2391724.1 hypothetical protein [Aeromicrobium fastidiosum]